MNDTWNFYNLSDIYLSDETHPHQVRRDSNRVQVNLHAKATTHEGLEAEGREKAEEKLPLSLKYETQLCNKIAKKHMKKKRKKKKEKKKRNSG